MKRRSSQGPFVDDFRAVLEEGLGARYAIADVLGSGGMALVFEAHDRTHDRSVAIKVLSPEIASAVATERFIREILWSAKLQHPHIVPVLDSGEVAGFPYLVMPFIEGETLAAELAERGRLPVRTAVKYATEVAAALDYAHRKGVVHRDVKPDNILISDGYAMVADFGVARALGIASGNTLTGAGSPIGTLAYMSPEQSVGSPDVDGRTDIYSLGCVAYEMLSGHRVFDGTTLRQIMAQQLQGDAPPLETLCPELGSGIAQVIARALRKDPEDRYQTAREFGDALGSVDIPLAEPEPVRPASRTGLWLLVAAVAAVALLVSMLLAR